MVTQATRTTLGDSVSLETRQDGHRAVSIDIAGTTPQRTYYYLGEQPDARLVLWQHLDDLDACRDAEYGKR